MKSKTRKIHTDTEIIGNNPEYLDNGIVVIDWQLEKIVGERKLISINEKDENGNSVVIPQYFCKWKGFDDDSNTWEPREHIEMCTTIINRWERLKELINYHVPPVEFNSDLMDEPDDPPRPLPNVPESLIKTKAKPKKRLEERLLSPSSTNPNDDPANQSQSNQNQQISIIPVFEHTSNPYWQQVQPPTPPEPPKIDDSQGISSPLMIPQNSHVSDDELSFDVMGTSNYMRVLDGFFESDGLNSIFPRFNDTTSKIASSFFENDEIMNINIEKIEIPLRILPTLKKQETDQFESSPESNEQHDIGKYPSKTGGKHPPGYYMNITNRDKKIFGVDEQPVKRKRGRPKKIPLAPHFPPPPPPVHPPVRVSAKKIPESISHYTSIHAHESYELKNKSKSVSKDSCSTNTCDRSYCIKKEDSKGVFSKVNDRNILAYDEAKRNITQNDKRDLIKNDTENTRNIEENKTPSTNSFEMSAFAKNDHCKSAKKEKDPIKVLLKEDDENALAKIETKNSLVVKENLFTLKKKKTNNMILKIETKDLFSKSPTEGLLTRKDESTLTMNEDIFCISKNEIETKKIDYGGVIVSNDQKLLPPNDDQHKVIIPQNVIKENPKEIVKKKQNITKISPKKQVNRRREIEQKIKEKSKVVMKFYQKLLHDRKLPKKIALAPFEPACSDFLNDIALIKRGKIPPVREIKFYKSAQKRIDWFPKSYQKTLELDDQQILILNMCYWRNLTITSPNLREMAKYQEIPGEILRSYRLSWESSIRLKKSLKLKEDQEKCMQNLLEARAESEKWELLKKKRIVVSHSLEEYFQFNSITEDFKTHAKNALKMINKFIPNVYYRYKDNNLYMSCSADDEIDEVVPYQNVYSGWKKLNKNNSYSIYIFKIYSIKDQNSNRRKFYVKTLDSNGMFEVYHLDVFRMVFPDMLKKYLMVSYFSKIEEPPDEEDLMFCLMNNHLQFF